MFEKAEKKWDSFWAKVLEKVEKKTVYKILFYGAGGLFGAFLLYVLIFIGCIL